MKIDKRILDQCSDCHYWHDDVKDEHGNKWVPFCDLFHGNGIAIPCDQHMTEEEYKSLKDSLKRVKYEKSVPFKDILDKVAVAGNEAILERDEDTEFCFNCLNYEWDERYCVLDGDSHHRHHHCGFWELAAEYNSLAEKMIEK